MWKTDALRTGVTGSNLVRPPLLQFTCRCGESALVRPVKILSLPF